MKCTLKSVAKSFPSENLLLFVPKNDKLFSKDVQGHFPKLPALLKTIAKEEDFKGDAGRHMVYPGVSKDLPGVKRLVLIGLGDVKKDGLLEAMCSAMGKAMHMLPGHGINDVAFAVDMYDFSENLAEAAEHLAMHGHLGAYQFLTYKTKNVDAKKSMKACSFVVKDSKKSAAVKKALKRAETIDEYVTLARDLSNEPSHVAGPVHMEQRARDLAKRYKMKVQVIDKAGLKKKGMNLFYAVGQGAVEGPRMVKLSYRGNPKSKDVYAMVGKGITFDTGGTSLKPAAYMRHMKVDMTGSSTVLGAICAVAGLGTKVNVDAYLCLAENAIGKEAYKPDDVITAYNGLTVEIENTDAEGRLVMADTLTYACESKPKQLIDVATLTGAATFVTGGMAAPFMGTDEKLIEDLKKASKNTGERLWELPLWDDFDIYLKSKIADVVNCFAGRAHPGSIAAGAFLKQFVDKKVSWAHIDIAGVTLSEDKHGSYTHGPSGFGVRLLTNWLESKAK